MVAMTSAQVIAIHFCLFVLFIKETTTCGGDGDDDERLIKLTLTLSLSKYREKQTKIIVQAICRFNTKVYCQTTKQKNDNETNKEKNK